MADAAPDTTDLEPLYRQLLQQTLAPQPVAPPASQQPSPSSHEGRGWLSLLGEALGGGEQYGTTAERETGGLRALQSMGATMLQGSDYSYRPHTFGSILGAGMGAAQRSLGETQSVSAAQAAAAQDYQDKQQEQRLARIKEAVPLLTQLQTLQQQKRVAGMPSSLGGTPGTIPGTSLAELTGDKAHDLPLIAQRESGGDPTALNYVAKADPTAYDRGATASGKYQIVNSTWAEGVKLAGLDPSKYATARAAPESVQDQVASALFDKYGNKPWQKGTTDWVKGDGGRYTLQTVTRPPAAPPGAPTPPPATVEARPPQTPPPAATAPPRAAPAIAPDTGSGQVAGPGAPTVGAPLPPSPAVAGNVNAIIGGMTGAGANASTLAPGPAVPVPQTTTQASTQPQPPPAVETTPPAPAPTLAAGPPTFTYERHDPPPGMLLGSKLTPEEQSVVQDARNAYQNAIRVAITPEQRQQAEATLQATLDKELTARAGRTDTAAKQMADWYANDFKQQQEAHKQAVDNFYQNQNQQQKFQNDLAIKQAEAEQTRLTNKEQVFNQANQKGLESAQTEQAAARDTVAQLEGFRTISDGVGQPGWLQTTKFPGSDQSLAERLQQLGIKSDDTGGVQLLRGAMTNMVRTLRTGMSMGSLSDRDLDFIQRMGPTEWMDPDTRAAAVGYLQQAYRAKMRFSSDVQKEMSRGKNYGDAVDAADAKQKPFVPQVPADLSSHWTDMSPEWAQRRGEWAQQNEVRAGTLIHMNDGRIVVIKRPPRSDKGQG